MTKIAYSTTDGSVCIVCPSPKEEVETILGPLTDKEFMDHVLQVSIPSDAFNIRELSDGDMPASREFRQAWTDVTSAPSIDIDCLKVKNILLDGMRKKRNKKLLDTDAKLMQALERQESITDIKILRQALRDATEPLKAVAADGVLNDNELVESMKQLAVVPE